MITSLSISKKIICINQTIKNKKQKPAAAGSLNGCGSNIKASLRANPAFITKQENRLKAQRALPKPPKFDSQGSPKDHKNSSTDCPRRCWHCTRGMGIFGERPISLVEQGQNREKSAPTKSFIAETNTLTIPEHISTPKNNPVTTENSDKQIPHTSNPWRYPVQDQASAD